MHVIIEIWNYHQILCSINHVYCNIIRLTTACIAEISPVRTCINHVKIQELSNFCEIPQKRLCECELIEGRTTRVISVRHRVYLTFMQSIFFGERIILWGPTFEIDSKYHQFVVNRRESERTAISKICCCSCMLELTIESVAAVVVVATAHMFGLLYFIANCKIKWVYFSRFMVAT